MHPGPKTWSHIVPGAEPTRVRSVRIRAQDTCCRSVGGIGKEWFGLCRVARLPMDGRHAELHPALLASGKGSGKGLRYMDKACTILPWLRKVRAVDLSLEGLVEP